MQVFIANIDSISKNPDEYMALLSPQDRVRASAFHKQTRKLQFILGHLMANKVGGKYTSIAHKDKFVVVATASNASVGIDIENTTVKRDFVSASAIMGIKTPKTLQDFYHSFTEFEATYKLSMAPVCTRFITYGDYLICVTANHEFAAPRLRNFDITSISSPNQE